MTKSNVQQVKHYKRAIPAGQNRFDISSSHYTTCGFMNNRPIYFRELAPKQHVHLELQHYIRTAPTNQPLFNHFDCRFNAFYLPYSMVWTKFNEFITQSLRDGSRPSSVPLVSRNDMIYAIEQIFMGNAEVYKLIANDKYGDETECAGYDYCLRYYTDSTTRTFCISLNGEGYRNLFTTLDTLGYRLGHLCGANGISYDNDYSALPLLCWTKIWYDFYKVADKDSFPFEPDKVTKMTRAQLVTIFGRMATNSIAYAKDYFCNNETPDEGGNTNTHVGTGTNRPVSFDNGRSSALVTGYNTDSAQSINKVGIGAPNATAGQTETYIGANAGVKTLSPVVAGTDVGFTKQALTQLGALSDYVKRISVAGFNSAKRFLTEYGVSIPETSVLKTAQYLADYTTAINAQEITCTDSTGLGAQKAASLKGSGNFTIDYTATEIGALIVYMNIRPKQEFVFGCPRWATAHKLPFDFYHPDFDGYGYQATRRDELHVSMVPTTDNHWLDSERSLTYGVLPVYAEYKAGFSCASGDFNRPTTSSTFIQYHTARIPQNVDTAYQHSSMFLKQVSGESSPKRVFATTNYDPFICHLDFNGYIDAPMKPLFDLPGTWSCENGAVGSTNGDERAHL